MKGMDVVMIREVVLGNELQRDVAVSKTSMSLLQRLPSTHPPAAIRKPCCCWCCGCRVVTARAWRAGGGIGGMRVQVRERQSNCSHEERLDSKPPPPITKIVVPIATAP